MFVAWRGAFWQRCQGKDFPVSLDAVVGRRAKAAERLSPEEAATLEEQDREIMAKADERRRKV